jgi:hypothetical protein
MHILMQWHFAARDIALSITHKLQPFETNKAHTYRNQSPAANWICTAIRWLSKMKKNFYCIFFYMYNNKSNKKVFPAHTSEIYNVQNFAQFRQGLPHSPISV